MCLLKLSKRQNISGVWSKMPGVQAGRGGLAGSVLLVMDSLKHLLEQDFLSRYCSPQRERAKCN